MLPLKILFMVLMPSWMSCPSLSLPKQANHIVHLGVTAIAIFIFHITLLQNEAMLLGTLGADA